MKKYKLDYSDTALMNLRDIVSYIAADNKQKAIEYRQGVEKVILNLSDFPYSGKKRNTSENERMCFYWNHKICYTVNEISCTVEIEYISHGAMKERK